MNKLLLIGGLAACLPLLATANAEMEKELNGLDIETSLSPVSPSTTSGPATSRGGTQLLKLTNRSSHPVECLVKPGGAEAGETVEKANLAPGESAALRVQSDPSGTKTDAKLVCMPANNL